ncbi:MAG TPA: nuclear transport factor 2 family protein [Granulicella sp.]|jgi:hypothetical protein
MNAHLVLRRWIVGVCLMPLALTCSFAQSTPAATEASPTLFQTISAQDSVLFNAVNTCDLATVESKFAENLEFYHDKHDPQYGRKVVVDSIKENLCGKIQRELVPGSLEVYPIQGYGAVEIGVHRFHHIGAQDRDVVGEAKFIHLWRLKDGAWQITRVISYDHATAK